MKKSLTLAILLSLTSSLVAELTPQEIANQAAAKSYYQGNTGRAFVSMSIVDSRNRERQRQLTILRKDSEDLGEQQFFVYFTEPSDVFQTTFLVHKKPQGDDDRWLYLPALDLVRRIASGDQRTSFVGSHFYYEDVSGRSPLIDNHELIETTETFYVLKSTPKDPATVEFDSYKTWIHKASFLPIKTEYYNSKGEVYRIYEALRVDNIDGFQTVTQSRMTDKERNGQTTLTYHQVNYNLDLDSDIFTERSLRTPPAAVRR